MPEGRRPAGPCRLWWGRCRVTNNPGTGGVGGGAGGPGPLPAYCPGPGVQLRGGHCPYGKKLGSHLAFLLPGRGAAAVVETTVPCKNNVPGRADGTAGNGSSRC